MLNLGCPLGKLVDQTYVILQELTNQLMMFSLFCIVILSYSPVAPVKTRKKTIIRCYSKSSGNEKDVEI